MFYIYIYYSYIYIGVYLHFYVGVYIFFFFGGHLVAFHSLSIYIYREREGARESGTPPGPQKYVVLSVCFHYFMLLKRGKRGTWQRTFLDIYIYIYIQKGTLSGPPFSTFLEMQCFCYIMFNPLCPYTCDGIARDPHRLSDFLRGCQRMSRESWRFPGKRKEEKQT